ncbi:MAG: hypothetical protein Q9174_005446 [Haloplaca sp. 1 TL-2023]
MAVPVAVLCATVANGPLRDICTLKFPSSNNKEDEYFVYENLQDNTEPIVQVSNKATDQPAVVALYITRDAVKIEAYTNTVQIPCSWIGLPSKDAFVLLAPSTPERRILHHLRPDEKFKIRDAEFILQAREVQTVESIQVMSSRPDSVSDEGIHTAGGKSETSPPDRRPATPHLESNPAVMETPVSHRYEPRSRARRPLANCLPSENGEANGIASIDTSQEVVSAAPAKVAKRHRRSPSTRDEGMLEGSLAKPISPPAKTREPEISRKPEGLEPPSGASDNGLPSGATASTETDSGLIEYPAYLDINQELLAADASSRVQSDKSSQTTEGSNGNVGSWEPSNMTGSVRSASREPSIPTDSKPVNPRKRRASSMEEVQATGDATKATLDEAAEPTIAQSLPRKRPRGATNTRKTKANAESQNSVKSTIRVEPGHLPSSPPGAETKLSPILDHHNEIQETPSKPDSPIPLIRFASAEETPSSNRSTRSTAATVQNKALRIVYSSTSKIADSSAYNTSLRKRNVKKVKNVKDCDVFVVAKGNLMRTFNLLLAVLLGKDVVTDEWITRSVKAEQMLDPGDFQPRDKEKEKAWGSSIGSAIDRGKGGHRPLKGWTITFTPTLKKELGNTWSELKEVCLVAGATAVQAFIPKNSPDDVEATIIIGSADGEPDAGVLEERGWKVFEKEIVLVSIWRGKVDVGSDEFLLKPPPKKGGESAKKKKKRG